MTKPFAGVRILDFTRYVAGPFGTYQLALLGADVVKIEPKAGDDMRHSQLSKEWAAKGLGPSFMGINSNKRSLTLDLRKPKAVEIVKRLAKTADIVWENFRPGIMERFGLGYETLKGINPRLIYCAVSGFGQNGPERGTAAFDGKLQARFGNLSSTGKVTGNRFKAGDGDLMLAVMTERQFANLMKTLGREDALADPRFADWPSRGKNEPALRAIIEGALAADSAKNWETRLTAMDVPSAGIW